MSFSSAYANPYHYKQAAVTLNGPIEDNILNKEVKDAIYALQHDFEQVDVPFIRFFSTYAVPDELRQKTALTCSFVLTSLTGVPNNQEISAGAYRPIAKMVTEKDMFQNDIPTYKDIQLVRDSKTLYWIDLRDYNFTEQAWEILAGVDPYFIEPIAHHPENTLLRLLAGNAVVRMDWFIYHATDITSEVNSGRNIRLYNALLYASNKEPKNVREFEKIFGLGDVEKSRQLGNEYAALVTQSKNVALHNRLLFGYRTEIGWLYRSYDTLSEEGFRDYVEGIYTFAGKPPPPTAYDAGEIFATNHLRMQVYALFNNKEELIDFADPRVARHLRDVTGNSAVRVPHSCMDCHAAGPIPSENTVKDAIEARIKLYLPKKQDAQRVERAFLSNKFEDAVDEDQKAFAKALKHVNGLEPDENARNYLEVISYYDKPLDLQQICRETGVPIEKIQEAADKGLQDVNRKTPGRLQILLKNGQPISRGSWDSPGKDGIPGVFQQTMLMIYGFTTIKEEVKYEDVVPVSYKVVADCKIMAGPKEVGSLKKDEILTQEMIITSMTYNDALWVKVRVNGIDGWILDQNILKQ